VTDQSAPAWKWRAAKWAAWLLSSAVLIFGIVVGVRWLAASGIKPAVDNQTLSMEEEWNRTIRRLGVGIEPVYPPQEDLSVGDVFATVVADDLQLPATTTTQGKRVTPSTPFLGRSVKLGHIDLTKELETAYAQIPVFPEPGVRAQSGESGTAPIVPASLFGQRLPHPGLPLAAFPGFTIHYKGSASAGVAASSRGWFDFSASNEDSLRLILGVVETYGLDVVTAGKALTDYCQKPLTLKLCIEENMRKYLRPLVPNVFEKFVDPNSTTLAKVDRYAVTVRLIMVNRVYLAREILEQRSIGRATGGGAQASQAKAPAPVAGITSMDQRIATIEKQLADLQSGGTLTFQTNFGADMLMDVKFARPVAIGYRAIQYDREEEPSK